MLLGISISEVAWTLRRGGKQTVSARELHEKLEVGTQFKDWIKRMIEYGFEENVDYVLVAQERATNNPKNPITTFNEYYISIDMAKDVADWIEISNVLQMLQSVDEDEKGIYSAYTLGGNQDVRM